MVFLKAFMQKCIQHSTYQLQLYNCNYQVKVRVLDTILWQHSQLINYS